MGSGELTPYGLQSVEVLIDFHSLRLSKSRLCSVSDFFFLRVIV